MGSAWPEFNSPLPDLMKTLYLPLLRKRELANNTFAFHFPKPPNFSYIAGQYVSLSVAPPEIAGPNGTMRELSMVSAPHEKIIELALRFRESRAKKQFLKLRSGDKAYIQGPFGSFQLEKNDKGQAVFLAGGIGIVPFISMLKDDLYNGQKNDFFIFFSNRREIDIPYASELHAIAEKEPTVFLIPTLTAELPTSWQHETGYISPEMIKKYIRDPKQAMYYLSGPVWFVGGMWEVLGQLGIPEKRIRGEEFTGY